MPSVTIWSVESDHDARAVKCLAANLASYLQLDQLSIRWAGRQAFRPVQRKSRSSNYGLKDAVSNYLRQDSHVIFVIDKDSPRSMNKRRQEPNSLIRQIERVTNDKDLKGRVFLILAVQELEAWLLIDCLGISCYFASKRTKYKENCRDKISKEGSLGRLVRRRQKGDTELIVEADSGGRGPKEYLESFSKEILLELNPRLSQRDAKKRRYSEKMSPEIAEYVIISHETLKRNESLRDLGNLLARLK